ncbi:uncharacterized protein METZ01_LOCUS88989 [marine metagenome]|uniref:Uncharacterized protein n=1 Tax=marine metagenome TaxID=408172 RepID=A0A381V6Y6_9ZZZZ
MYLSYYLRLCLEYRNRIVITEPRIGYHDASVATVCSMPIHPAMLWLSPISGASFSEIVREIDC